MFVLVITRKLWRKLKRIVLETTLIPVSAEEIIAVYPTISAVMEGKPPKACNKRITKGAERFLQHVDKIMEKH